MIVLSFTHTHSLSLSLFLSCVRERARSLSLFPSLSVHSPTRSSFLTPPPLSHAHALFLSRPTGYSKISAENAWDQQKCEPCLKGEECTNMTCVKCSQCAPGHYKAAISTESCAVCRSGTYREDPGSLRICVVDVIYCLSPHLIRLLFLMVSSSLPPVYTLLLSFPASLSFSLSLSFALSLFLLFSLSLAPHIYYTGATEVGNCLECPMGADTRGVDGQTSSDACVCSARFYLSDPQSSGAALECVRCPRGLECPDASCSIQSSLSESPLCETGNSVIKGTWIFPEGLAVLVACPTGFRLFNQSGFSKLHSEMQRLEPICSDIQAFCFKTV